MRLLAVRLQNLNSLSGRSHEVRFDAPPLSQAGVFLITGPTGAGKSTLLDAITLALYGRAARYGNDKADEMMSRHTAECLAEVDFEAGGRQLRATWRLSRTRTGNLKPVQRTLADRTTEKILAERSRDIDLMIEQFTGLDAQRFLRSVLLAQGQFAAFLKAKPNERAELLEKITGTGIYSELSMLAFETHKEKQEAVTQLQIRLGALAVLGSEERAALQDQAAVAKGAAAQCQAEHDAAVQRLNASKQTQQLHEEHARIVHETGKIGAELTSLAQQQTENTAQLSKAETALAQTKAARDEREPVWDKAAQATARRGELEAQLTTSREAYKKLSLEQKTAANLQAEREKALADHGQRTSALQAWLEDHAKDAGLSQKVAASRTALTEWRKAFQALAEARRLHGEKVALTKRAGECQSATEKLSAELKDLQQKLAGHRGELARMAVSCEQQQVIVEQAQNMASFEEHRQDLKEGEACPLCGATDHPFKTEAVSFVSQLQTARQLLKSLEQQRDAAQRNMAAAEQSTARSEAKLDAERKRMDELNETLKQIQAPDDAALASLEKGEAEVRLPLGPTPDEADRVLAGMEQQARVFVAKQTEAHEQQARRQKLEGDLQLARQDSQAKAARLEELKNEGIKLKETADAVQKELIAWLGELTLDEDRQKYGQLVAVAEQKVRQTEAGINALRNRAAAAQASLDQLQRRQNDLAPKVNDTARITPEILAKMEAETAQAAELLAAKQRTVGSLEEQLRKDDEIRRIREAAGREVELAEAEALRWGKLKELIGSADGARFARFAQSLTLLQLVSLANHHLQILTPRYRLIAAEGDELDLRIVDLYQAGVDRPMESLSGGESFLASLALALGLSELASRHHPIDSLFIDEGFGTLDGDTLETAMAALENLRANGKSIGVISHVEAMKERITTQIRVTKLDGGCSRLEVVG